jgi:phosphoadenosine phosphosulfate reductase
VLESTDLFGTTNKVEKAIETLKYFEPPDGYWVGISGGKDSDVILELCKMADVQFEAHHTLTTIDKPETIYHIRRDQPEVDIISPPVPFLTMLETRGFPLRQGRWCCEVYKEYGGNGRRVVTGIRKAESSRRSKRQTFEHCYKGGLKGKGKTFVHPIIDWTDDEVWEFHKMRGVVHCTLYDQGAKRLGCLFCPMARPSERMADLTAYPRFTKLFIRSFERLFNKRKAAGKKSVDRWESGEAMFYWWVNEKTETKDVQPQLFRFDD